jgi:hypothetical protein
LARKIGDEKLKYFNDRVYDLHSKKGLLSAFLQFKIRIICGLQIKAVNPFRINLYHNK